MDNIADWLEGLGLGHYATRFADEGIDLAVVTELDNDDLRELGVDRLGDRKRLLKAISVLSAEPGTPEDNVLERRVVSTMFCDLAGSTALSQEVGAEDLRRIMSRYLDLTTAIVERHQGFVGNFTGDGVMAYFGWPTAAEDQAVHAVRAGLEITDGVHQLSPPGHPLHCRVGIATGRVVIGSGADHGLTFGPTLNLAARLEGVAAHDTVVICPTTATAVGRRFDLELMPPVTLKGFAEPVACATVGAERRLDRFSATSITETPMVGRRNEARSLDDAWQRARSGQGVGVRVVGDAGMGKSRLVRDFLDRADVEQNIVFQCAADQRSTPFHPLLPWIGAELDRDRSSLFGRGLSDDDIALLDHMLSEETDVDAPQDGSTTRIAFIELLRDCLAGRDRAPTTVVLFEDIHWADPSTMEIIAALESAPSHDFLLIATSRTDEASLPESAVTITVGPLDDEATEALARAAARNLPPERVAQIVDRVDGVPLFAQELAIAQAEDPDAADLSESLEASLTARLDRSGSARRTAQAAAVLGRDIDLDRLAQVITAANLERDLAQLVDDRILEPVDEGRLRFTHALLRDVAYTTLVSDDRVSIHGHVADVLLGEPDGPDVTSAVLAYHLTGAERFPEAIDRWRRAGMAAYHRSAALEALDHFETARRLATRVDDERQHRLALEFDVLAVRATTAHYGYASAEEEARIDQAIGRHTHLETSDVGDQVWELFALLTSRLTSALVSGGDIDHLAEQALRLAASVEDPTLDFLTHRFVGSAAFVKGDLESADAAFDVMDRGFDPSRHRSSIDGVNVASAVLGARAMGSVVRLLRGAPAGARDMRSRCLALGEELGAGHHRGLALFWANFHAFLERDTSGQTLVHHEICALNESVPMNTWPLMADAIFGWVIAEQGDLTRGIATLSKGIEAVLATGTIRLGVFYTTRLAELHLTAGALEAAEEALDETASLFDRSSTTGYIAEYLRVRALVALARGHTGQAIETLEAAAVSARDSGAGLLELRVATTLVEVDPNAARLAALQDIIARFDGEPEIADLAAARAALATMSLQNDR